MKKFEKIISTWVAPVLTAVVGGVLLYFIAVIFDVVLNKSEFAKSLLTVLGGIWICVTIAFGSIISLFRAPIPLWIVLVLVVLVAAFARHSWRKSSGVETLPRSDAVPRWLSYTVDDFNGWRFTWKYNQAGTVIGLDIICACGCGLTKENQIRHAWDTTVRRTCPNCGKVYREPTRKDFIDAQHLIVFNANKLAETF